MECTVFLSFFTMYNSYTHFTRSLQLIFILSQHIILKNLRVFLLYFTKCSRYSKKRKQWSKRGNLLVSSSNLRSILLWKYSAPNSRNILLLWQTRIYKCTPCIKFCHKVKVKCTLVHELRLCTGRTAHRGSRGIAVLYRNCGSVQGVRHIGGVEVLLYCTGTEALYRLYGP